MWPGIGLRLVVVGVLLRRHGRSGVSRGRRTAQHQPTNQPLTTSTPRNAAYPSPTPPSISEHPASKCSETTTTTILLPCDFPSVSSYRLCADSVRELNSSPQGRIFQVEYALEAIKQGSVAVGLVSKTHAVLVALKVQLTMMERDVGLMEVGC